MFKYKVNGEMLSIKNSYHYYFFVRLYTFAEYMEYKMTKETAREKKEYPLPLVKLDIEFFPNLK